MGSYDTPVVPSGGLGQSGNNERHLKVAEERIHQKVDHDERCEHDVQSAHEDKAPLQPRHINFQARKR